MIFKDKTILLLIKYTYNQSIYIFTFFIYTKTHIVTIFVNMCVTLSTFGRLYQHCTKTMAWIICIPIKG